MYAKLYTDDQEKEHSDCQVTKKVASCKRIKFKANIVRILDYSKHVDDKD